MWNYGCYIGTFYTMRRKMPQMKIFKTKRQRRQQSLIPLDFFLSYTLHIWMLRIHAMMKFYLFCVMFHEFILVSWISSKLNFSDTCVCMVLCRNGFCLINGNCGREWKRHTHTHTEHIAFYLFVFIIKYRKRLFSLFSATRKGKETQVINHSSYKLCVRVIIGLYGKCF